MSHGVPRGPPCFLDSYWSVGAAESSLSPWLGQWFMCKGNTGKYKKQGRPSVSKCFWAFLSNFRPCCQQQGGKFVPIFHTASEGCWFLIFLSENSVKHINLINYSVKKGPVRDSRLYLCLSLFETLKGGEKKDIRCVWVIVLRLRNCNWTRKKSLYHRCQERKSESERGT